MTHKLNKKGNIFLISLVFFSLLFTWQSFAENQRRSKSKQQNGGGREPRAFNEDQLKNKAPKDIQLEFDIAYREGNKLWTLDIAYPKTSSTSSIPAIIIIHGGGFKKGDKRQTRWADSFINFAKLGYVAVNLNYRLGEGVKPCIQDVKCAVRWVRAHASDYNINPDKIGAFGNSAGGHLALMLGVSSKEKKLDDGPWQNYSSYVQAVAAGASPLNKIRNKTNILAPIKYINKDLPDILLLHEASDSTVPVGNSDDFASEAKKAGAKNVIYKRYTDGSGHSLVFSNKMVFPEIEKFFKSTLKP